MKRIFQLLVVLGMLPAAVFAQDDDLYFVPKAQPKTVKPKQPISQNYFSTYYGGIDCDVDTYNRRGHLRSTVQPLDNDSLQDVIDFHEGDGVYPDSLCDDTTSVYSLPYKKKRQSDYSIDDDFTYSRRLIIWDGFYGWHYPYYYSHWAFYDPWYDPWYDGWGYYGWYSPYYTWSYRPYWGYPYYGWSYAYYGWHWPYRTHYVSYGHSGSYGHGLPSYNTRNYGYYNRQSTTYAHGRFGGSGVNRSSSNSRNNIVGNKTDRTIDRRPFGGNRNFHNQTPTRNQSYGNNNRNSTPSFNRGASQGSFRGGSFGGGRSTGGSFGGGRSGGGHFGGRR